MTKISILQSAMITISSVTFMNQFFVTPVILSSSGRDAWLAILFTIIPCLFWLFLLYTIVRKSNQQHIGTWLKSKYGSFLAWVVSILSGFYLFGMAFLTLKFVIPSTSSYFSETPPIVFVLLALTLCFFTAKSGIQSIAIFVGFTFPYTIILYLFILFANIPNKDFSRLLPLLEYNLDPIWNGMFFAGAGLMEMMIMVWMQHQLASKVRFWHLLLIAAVILILTFESVSSSIAEFGPTEAAKQLYPYLEQWKLVQIGLYMTHFDFFFIYLWLITAYIRISIALYSISELYTKNNKKSSTTFLLVISVLLLICYFIPISVSQFYFILTHYYFPITFAILIFLSLLFFLLSLVKPKGVPLHD